MNRVPSQKHRAIATWLVRAEREYRAAFESVQRTGTDAARARYARAKADLESAFEASTQALTFAAKPQAPA